MGEYREAPEPGVDPGVELQHALDALEAGERRFRALFAAIPDLIMRLSADGTYLDYSPASSFETYVPADQFLGKTLADVLPPEVAGPSLAAIGRALRTGEEQAVEYQLPADGELRYYEARIAPCGTDEVVAIIRDETQRKEAEAAATRLGRILENSLNEIYIFDADTLRFIEVTRGARTNLGYTIEELRQLTPLDVKPEFEAASFDEMLEPLRSGKTEIVRFTTVHLRKDGSRYPVEVHLQQSVLGSAPVFVAIILDISARKEAERSLQRSEAEYRALFEHATYGIYRSAGNRFLAANPALVEMLGYETESDLLSLDLGSDVYADPNERASLIAKYGNAEVISDVEVSWKRKDGDVIRVRLNGRPIHGEGGEPSCFEMIAEDITHRRALEAQLRQAQKMEAIGQLTGGIAHDFNNILTVIQANTESVNALLPDTFPELHAGLEEVLVAARRGTALVKRLLGFSRQAMLRWQSVDLAELTAELLATLTRLIPAEIEIRFESEHALPAIRADRGAVEQMLLNLATNARDAMPDGGVMHITTALVPLDEPHRSARGWGEPGEYVRLRVTDTGTGMDSQTRDKIFEPFFTTKPHGQGTGLGMAMLYGLVKQHQGYVDVLSAPGEGTSIDVYFPLAPQHATESNERYAKREPQGGTETVLLAEDEAPIRQAAKRVLERYGYEVLLAADGVQALELFRRHKQEVQIVISDLVMPRMGGRDLYAAVQWEAPSTPFLFMSGYSSKERLGLTKIPSASFIQKPWTVADLLLGVREVLDR